jgi:hypothetical protein
MRGGNWLIAAILFALSIPPGLTFLNRTPSNISEFLPFSKGSASVRKQVSARNTNDQPTALRRGKDSAHSIPRTVSKRKTDPKGSRHSSLLLLDTSTKDGHNCRTLMGASESGGDIPCTPETLSRLARLLLACLASHQPTDDGVETVKNSSNTCASPIDKASGSRFAYADQPAAISTHVAIRLASSYLRLAAEHGSETSPGQYVFLSEILQSFDAMNHLRQEDGERTKPNVSPSDRYLQTKSFLLNLLETHPVEAFMALARLEINSTHAIMSQEHQPPHSLREAARYRRALPYYFAAEAWAPGIQPQNAYISIDRAHEYLHVNDVEILRNEGLLLAFKTRTDSIDFRISGQRALVD